MCYKSFWLLYTTQLKTFAKATHFLLGQYYLNSDINIYVYVTKLREKLL